MLTYCILCVLNIDYLLLDNFNYMPFEAINWKIYLEVGPVELKSQQLSQHISWILKNSLIYDHEKVFQLISKWETLPTDLINYLIEALNNQVKQFDLIVDELARTEFEKIRNREWSLYWLLFSSPMSKLKNQTELCRNIVWLPWTKREHKKHLSIRPYVHQVFSFEKPISSVLASLLREYLIKQWEDHEKIELAMISWKNEYEKRKERLAVVSK